MAISSDTKQAVVGPLMIAVFTIMVIKGWGQYYLNVGNKLVPWNAVDNRTVVAPEDNVVIGAYFVGVETLKEKKIRALPILADPEFEKRQEGKNLREEFYALNMTDIWGNVVSFETFRGKVLLIVNTASRNPHAYYNFPGIQRTLDVLEAVHDEHFDMLMFPSNQFGYEPSTLEELQEHYIELGVDFPMFPVSEIDGPNANPAYKNILAQFGKPPPRDFFKFIIDHTGKVDSLWDPRYDWLQVGIAVRDCILKAADIPFDTAPIPDDVNEESPW